MTWLRTSTRRKSHLSKPPERREPCHSHFPSRCFFKRRGPPSGLSNTWLSHLELPPRDSNMSAAGTPPENASERKSGSPGTSSHGNRLGHGGGAGSIQPLAPQGPHVETQPALDVATADDVDDDEFDPQEYEAASNASTSIRSSIMEHEYESGRRVLCIVSSAAPLAADRNPAVSPLQTRTVSAAKRRSGARA